MRNLMSHAKYEINICCIRYRENMKKINSLYHIIDFTSSSIIDFTSSLTTPLKLFFIFVEVNFELK